MDLEKIIVNGALMDRTFFEDNVREAKRYYWEEVELDSLDSHGHCIICLNAIPTQRDEKVFKCNGLMLCDYCHTHFI